MDVRIVCVLLSALFISDIKCDVLGDVVNNNMMCSVKLRECSFHGDFASGGNTDSRIVPGMPGIKGDRGPRGPRGPKGEVCGPCMQRIDDVGLLDVRGPKGDEGMPGVQGMPGKKGDMGYIGMPGMKGDRGSPGIDGLPAPMALGRIGPRGYTGSPGRDGLPGLMGTTGLKGDTGAPGIPGMPGVCMQRCPDADSDSEDSLESLSEIPKAFGEESRPSPTTCRNAPDKVKGTDYWVMPKNKFLVTCDKITNRTCLKINKDFDLRSSLIEEISIKYEGMTKSFWLSQLGLNLADLYKISMDQLHWLQTQSSSVTQIIRYHCKNSYITAESDNYALRLLTWNDIVVGLHPTEVTPLFYSILPENHGCKPGADNTWHYSDIKLVDTTSKRLPVIDFHIRDVGRADQQVYLELLELCFG